MRSRQGRRHGQSMVEYSLIVAFIALATIAGIGYLQGKTNQAFQAQGQALGAPTFAFSTQVPPTATPTNTPTNTPTPIPPTATSTATATAIPPTATSTATATATATKTNTPVPPTATMTATATRTPTPAGPTPTRTPVPGCFYTNYLGIDYYACNDTGSGPPPGWNNCTRQYVLGIWYWGCPISDNK